MSFEHPIHNAVLRVLQCLDRVFFESCRIYFGGGTMLALNYGEYRLSKDIDFLCPYGAEFSQLRRAIYDRGYDALFVPSWRDYLQLPGMIKTDRDGVRFSIQVENVILKFEIVAEGRISLESPSKPDWSPVSCLSVIDQVAEKLLANGDRWADSSTDSRDLIDLAILKQHSDFPQAAIDKAEAAYRSIDPLKRSILGFQANPDYRSRCYQRLQVRSAIEIADGLDQLAQQFGLEPMIRQAMETEQAED
ncbi:nucleotidyl transferase AbiEii/AbiGii toxin family protein [Leptolyngbya sp. AN03gr2]|uniref:nucleotidyl transferase AbiEii/AbiGii toxin family protein n=1 Tax=unclassified Leptolyngbya TaxID=2650499 RepID=UPI003D31E2D6